MPMPNEIATHGFAAVLGAGAWEIAKHVVASAAKRRDDQADSKRKELRSDLSDVNERVSSCLESALEYFTSVCTPERRRELSRSTKHCLRVLGTSMHNLKVGLEATNLPQIEPALLITFRQAVTLRLDSDPFELVGHDAPAVNAMYRAAHHLQVALTRLRYSAT